MGLASTLGRECADELAVIARERANAVPAASAMAFRIREQYASYVGKGGIPEERDYPAYARECYLAVLARLVCANVLARRPLHSRDGELDLILGGGHFDAMGLRVVEHDQFHWLLRQESSALRPVARKIQDALFAYDFEAAPGDDLFGELLAGLADPDTRILLGQACTPLWLARLMAERSYGMLPENDPPRFVDMCCGSGAMLVAVTRLESERLRRAGQEPGSEPYVNALTRPFSEDHEERQLVGRAKKHVNFRVRQRTRPGDFSWRCLLSSHVVPFGLAKPSRAVLPFAYRHDAGWRPVTNVNLAGAPMAQDHFADAMSEGGFDTLEDFTAALDRFGKLTPNAAACR